MDSNSEKLSFLDILLVLFKRWKLIFFATFIAGFLSAGYAYFTMKAPVDDVRNKLPNKYGATVIVRADIGASTSASVLSSSGLAGILTGKSVTGANSEIQFILKLLNGLTLRQNLVEAVKAEGKWDHKITGGSLPGSIQTQYDSINAADILNIKYVDFDQEFALYMAKIVVQELEKRYTQFSVEKIQYKRQFLEDRIEQLEDDLSEAEKALNEFKRANSIIGMEAGMTSSGVYIQEMVFEKYIPKEQRYIIENKYSELNKEVAHFSNLLEILMKQFEAAKIEELDESNFFQIVEPPFATGLISPMRSQMVVIITGVTLLISILIAFIWSYIDRVREDEEESKKAGQIAEAITGRKPKRKRAE